MKTYATFPFANQAGNFFLFSNSLQPPFSSFLAVSTWHSGRSPFGSVNDWFRSWLPRARSTVIDPLQHTWQHRQETKQKIICILRSVPLRAWTFKFISKDLFRMKLISGQIFWFLISPQGNTVFHNELLHVLRGLDILPLGIWWLNHEPN